MKEGLSNNNSLSPSTLSQEDVLRLLEEPSAAVRVEVAEKIAKHYDTGTFNETQIQLANQILRFLVHDAEVRVRQVISENLRSNKDLPYDIVINMAKDIDEVSIPILEASELLTESDLVEIIKSTNVTARHNAIAKRSQLSFFVSDALVDTRNEQVVDTLIKNNGAKLSDKSYEKIIDQFADNEIISEALVNRESVPVSIAESLLSRVSEKLREKLEKKYKKATPRIREVVDQGREIATLGLLRMETDLDEVKTLVNHLYNTERLTPTMVINSLCLGNLKFFEVSLAKLANIPSPNAKTLVHDRSGLGFASLYQKAQLPESLFEAVKVVLAANTELSEEIDKDIKWWSTEYLNRLMEKIMQLTEETTVDNLSYMLAIIKKNAHHS